MRSFRLPSLVLCVVLLSAPYSNGHEKPRARPRHISKNNTFDAKYKRAENVPFTNFADGLGACGVTNGPNDFIAALNAAEYDDGAHCFEMITIVINGKTAEAQITDKCFGCGPGGLDLSVGLFQYFAPLDEGEIYGSWYYNTDKATPSSTLAPSYTPPPTPTTTVAAPTSTSSSTTIMTFSSSDVVPPPTSSISTVPTSTPQDPQLIVQINLALLELSTLLQASLKLET